MFQRGPDDPLLPTFQCTLGDILSRVELTTLAREWKEAKLSFSQHTLMDNRSGLPADLRIEEANGTAERTVGLEMLADVIGSRDVTVGGDKTAATRPAPASCRQPTVLWGVCPYKRSRSADGIAEERCVKVAHRNEKRDPIA